MGRGWHVTSTVLLIKLSHSHSLNKVNKYNDVTFVFMQFIPLRPEINETTNDQSTQLAYILSEPLYMF